MIPPEPVVLSGEMKRCSRCRREIPVEGFYKNRHRPDGRAAECIACYGDRQADRLARYASLGACRRCGRHVPVPGYLSCRKCLLEARRRNGSKPWKAGRRGRVPGFSPRREGKA